MKKPLWWFILVVALGGAAFLYFGLGDDKPQPQVASPSIPPPETSIRHPIEEVSLPDEVDAPEEPLPVLADSDKAMRDALEGLFGKRLEKFFNLQNLIHRLVATVDNLPLENAPLRVMPVKPVSGWLETAGKGENLSLSPKNAARYQTYVRLAESVPTGALVAMYVRFYPLFQKQYEELGYPEQYFNDRLVQVINHLLAAPEVEGPVRLNQVHVFYQFADPKLEELSAGQKIIVRIGRENAAKVKAKLREIRSALATKIAQD